jgi:membrane protein DedA with SNARE-associated domain
MFKFILENLTYPYIFLGMLLESTVFPVPSELVVAPAAYHAAAGYQNFWIIILVATIGAGIGASINYWVARIWGRPLIYRFANSKLGKMCLLNQEKVEKSERYFDKHGIAATLTGRLVPVIRHLISLPAGLARMNYWTFLLYTVIGAGVWHTILATLGWYLHSIMPEDQLNEDQLKTTIEKYNLYIILGIVAVVAIAILYFVIKKRKKGNKEEND